mgnify:CR=1 FL=1
MNYLEILKKSMKITWKHKSMWFFGILIAILGSGGSSPQLQYIFRGRDFTPQNTGRFAQQIKQPFNFLTPQIIIAILLISFVFVIAGVVLQYVSRGALIGMVNDVETVGGTQIGRGFKHGWSTWLRLFGISIFIWIPFAIIFLLVFGILFLPVILAFIKQREVFGFALLFLSSLIFMVCLVIAIALLTLTHSFAERFCVLEKRQLFESIIEGYRLFRSNPGSTLLMWLLMLVINMGIAMVTGVIFILPIIFGFFPNVSSLLAIVLLLPIVIAFVFAGGIYRTFVFTVWTLFFQELKNVAVPVKT